MNTNQYMKTTLAGVHLCQCTVCISFFSHLSYCWWLDLENNTYNNPNRLFPEQVENKSYLGQIHILSIKRCGCCVRGSFARLPYLESCSSNVSHWAATAPSLWTLPHMPMYFNTKANPLLTPPHQFDEPQASHRISNTDFPRLLPNMMKTELTSLWPPFLPP